MRVVIIEDETAAAKNLEAILREVMPSVEILATIESVEESVEYFTTRSDAELVFMDIHLADGQAFKIFEHVSITAPIIFTTAYDRYALEAFKVNSIDYILKPISAQTVQHALQKLVNLSGQQLTQKQQSVSAMASEQNKISKSILVHSRDRLIPISLEQVAYFYTQQGSTTLNTHSGESYTIDKSLDLLQGTLPEQTFIRANRQFIISRAAIRDMSIWFGSRLSLNLNIPTPERIIIAKAKVSEFKRWLLSEE